MLAQKTRAASRERTNDSQQHAISHPVGTSVPVRFWSVQFGGRTRASDLSPHCLRYDGSGHHQLYRSCTHRLVEEGRIPILKQITICETLTEQDYSREQEFDLAIDSNQNNVPSVISQRNSTEEHQDDARSLSPGALLL